MPKRKDRDIAVANAAPGSDHERMVRLLRYADFAEVGKALGLTGSAVHKWYWGTNVGAAQLRSVEDLLGRKETAPPWWAERLLIGMMALERERGISASDLADARAQVRKVLDQLGIGPGSPPQSPGGASGAVTP